MFYHQPKQLPVAYTIKENEKTALFSVISAFHCLPPVD